MLPTVPRRPTLPWTFHVWWVVATLTAVGDSMLAFALVWLATGHGADAVALVSTSVVVPRVLLLLLGGTLGDRYGPRRILLGSSMAQAVLLLAFGWFTPADPGVTVLALAALTTGIVSALQQPAATVYPRLLLDDDDQLPRALARVSGSLGVARILGVALAGALILVHPLTTFFTVAAASALLMLLGLLMLRPRTRPTAAPPTAVGGFWSATLDGLRAAHELRAGRLLGSVALVCAAVLPTIAVVVPVMARLRGWTAAEAARIDAVWGGGMLAVTLVVSVAGTLPRVGWALVGGPALCAVALIVLGRAPTPALATGAAGMLGVGTAFFTTHVAPSLIRLAPRDQMTRFQSLLTMTQMLPPMLLNAPAAALAASSAAAALGVAAVLVLAAALSHVRAEPLSAPSRRGCPRRR